MQSEDEKIRQRNIALRLGQAHVTVQEHKRLLCAEARRIILEATRQTQLQTRIKIQAELVAILDEIEELQAEGYCMCKDRYESLARPTP